MLQDLARDSPPHVRILAVDTACIMPAQLVRCDTEKAYIYRSSTAKPRRERITGMPYRDAGDLAKVAPYAAPGQAAAGSEDHPDAEGAETNAATQQQQHSQVRRQHVSRRWHMP
jgi:hypothetical protein